MNFPLEIERVKLLLQGKRLKKADSAIEYWFLLFHGLDSSTKQNLIVYDKLRDSMQVSAYSFREDGDEVYLIINDHEYKLSAITERSEATKLVLHLLDGLQPVRFEEFDN